MGEKDLQIALIKYNKKTWCKSAVLGFFIGLAIIVPGISGSTVAIIFKLYDQFLYALGNILKQFKRCFVFLLPIALTIFQNLGIFITYIERYKGIGYDFSPVNFSLVIYRLPVYGLLILCGKKLYREGSFSRILLLFSACALGCYLCKIRMVWLTRLSGYVVFAEGLLVEKCAKYFKNKQLFSTLCCLYFALYFLLIYGVFQNGEIVPFLWGVLS
jgi:hypothetical protein